MTIRHSASRTRAAAANGGRALLRDLHARRNDMLALLRRLVEIESPSDNKAAVDRLSAALVPEFERCGARVTLHRRPDFGDHLQADFAGEPGRPLLLLGHIDTVWDLGTLECMPFREARGRAFGPGIFDMKGGIVQALFALEALQRKRGSLPRPVTMLLVSDEEIGSHSSRAVTLKLAKASEAVFVIEPAAGPQGACKTGRKGVGVFQLKVIGQPAHAGLDFQTGHSAVLELARQIVRISGFTDLKRKLTVNAGVIRGGTRSNVVAAEAWTEIDVRIARAGDARGISRKLQSLKPFDRGCRLELTGGINRLPLERGPANVRLYHQARALAAELGFDLQETTVGGGSDGNFTAAAGVPTLDGLGAVGDGAHAHDEHVIVAELPRRAALLARLIESLRA